MVQSFVKILSEDEHLLVLHTILPDGRTINISIGDYASIASMAETGESVKPEFPSLAVPSSCSFIG